MYTRLLEPDQIPHTVMTAFQTETFLRIIDTVYMFTKTVQGSLKRNSAWNLNFQNFHENNENTTIQQQKHTKYNNIKAY